MSLIDGLLGGFLGQLGERIGSWLPGKSERYRAKIRQIKKQMDEIMQGDYSFNAKCRYDELAKLLAEYEAKLSDKE